MFYGCDRTSYGFVHIPCKGVLKYYMLKGHIVLLLLCDSPMPLPLCLGISHNLCCRLHSPGCPGPVTSFAEALPPSCLFYGSFTSHLSIPTSTPSKLEATRVSHALFSLSSVLSTVCFFYLLCFLLHCIKLFIMFALLSILPFLPHIT